MCSGRLTVPEIRCPIKVNLCGAFSDSTGEFPLGLIDIVQTDGPQLLEMAED